jgi:acetyl esterase/lipase
MKLKIPNKLFLTACVASPALAFAQGTALTPLNVPARSIPVPTTVSPEMQQIIAAPPTLNRTAPTTNDEWKARREAGAAARLKELPSLRERLGVKVEKQTIAAVDCYMVTPDSIEERNRNRLLISLHGGYYVFFPGESGTKEAIVMAAYGHVRVLEIDYRMPPDFPFPAGLDDALAVWKEEVKTANPANMAILGTSAGGGMALAMVLRAKQEGLPLPGAIAAGTPASDLTKTSDTYFTNESVDNSIVAYEPLGEAAAKLYANGHDLKDPLLSPVYGDFHGFPPAILTSGTRDLLLSDTVRVHRKLRQARVEAQLQVFEGQSHAQYLSNPFAPETKEAYEEIAGFFDAHLGR